MNKRVAFCFYAYSKGPWTVDKLRSFTRVELELSSRLYQGLNGYSRAETISFLPVNLMEKLRFFYCERRA
jgi:hypothetical protein